MLRRRLRERARFVGRLGRYQPLEVLTSSTGLDPRLAAGYGGLDVSPYVSGALSGKT